MGMGNHTRAEAQCVCANFIFILGGLRFGPNQDGLGNGWRFEPYWFAGPGPCLLEV